MVGSLIGKTRSFVDKLKRQHHFWLALLVLAVLILHFSVINQPQEYIFDEQWYAADAGTNIINGLGTSFPQQPPLGKLLITSGIFIFGDNSLGWRLFPIIFGAGGIVLLFYICLELKLPNRLAWLAAFLLAFENLSFVQSSISMLDVFSVTFMLAAFLAYLKNRCFTSGALIALSALTKFTGILAIPVIALHWLLTNRNRWQHFVPAIAAVPMLYLSLLVPLDFIIWGKFVNPVIETMTMLDLNSVSTFATIHDPILSRPWDWIINLKIITYWADPHYLAMISPPIWIAIVPSIGYMVYKSIKGDKAAKFIAAWFTGTFILWIPISLITDRTSYVFYFYPTVGAICMAVAVSLWDLVNYFTNVKSVSTSISKWIIPGFVLAQLAIFAFLAPVPYIWKLPICVMVYTIFRLFTNSEGNYEPLSAEKLNNLRRR
ncbi:Dolichyl-phosphate-mannose-protein mannosyltransferase [Dehalogenimonas formicexedens]|uniref:Dolichyl-phosphate-mannose-protein mannosyltransferase n=1 Tax=Dehalogenimonas formicexedens TaxID=1839801 RepID=A0A1P8F816_9CHLR|nr:phospholipid carrier-dependent glycosyltransferase [Dehalogenimonas formicexedens]APV44619.1 Dolichyl-phosphate-mannose-protein mannosyltransferase [Dehalogenimonas formicexedens]